MPQVSPLPMTVIPASLREAIEIAKESGVISSTLPVQIWAHKPESAEAWLATLSSFYSHSLLDDRLRELVRLKIASITGCVACQIARKSDTVTEQDLACLSPNSDIFTPQEQAALAYAESFTLDYMQIDDSDFSRLRHHFSEPAIVELNMFCALMLAGGRMTYVLKGYENDSQY